MTTATNRLALAAITLAATMAVARAQAPDPQHPAETDAAPASGTMPMTPDAMPGQPASMMGGDMGPMKMMRGMMAGDTGAMGMMRGMMAARGMEMPFDHIEGRIAYLKAELKITDAQAPLWSAVADAMRANAATMKTMQKQMGKGAMPTSLPARLQLQQQMMSAHLGAVNGLEAAVKPLYAVLSPEQRTTIDDTMAAPMGKM